MEASELQLTSLMISRSKKPLIVVVHKLEANF